jgi:hypothetical protein
MSNLTIEALVKQSHETARRKGWWGEAAAAGGAVEDRSPLEVAALIHSEISEFVEDMRRPPYDPDGFNFAAPAKDETMDKPIGPLIELADCIIRIADYCGRMEWDLEAALRLKMAYNRSRPYRHGGKAY